MKTFKYVLIVVIPLLATSCLGFICITGSGIYATEERTETGFVAIENTTEADIFFSTADEFSIFVEADDNLLRYIHTSVSSGNLEITVDGTPCIRPGRTPVIYITAPALEAVYSTGSGDIMVDSLRAEEVDVVNSGSGNIVVSSSSAGFCKIINTGSGDITLRDNYCDELSVKVTGSGNVISGGEAGVTDILSSGSGQVYLEQLTTTVCDATISGSGSVYIDILDELNATLSGSGNLYFTGNPVIYENRTGSGIIVNVNR